MGNLKENLIGLEFRHLEPSFQAKIQDLADELGTGVVFEDGDPLLILHDWYLLEANPSAKGKISGICQKIALVMAGVKNAPDANSFVAGGERSQQTKSRLPDQKFLDLMKKANASEQAHGFRTYVFHPSKSSSKKIIKTIEQAIDANSDVGQIEYACTKNGLGKAEAAFVLNFAKVYWPAFEDEPDLREDAKNMVGYLMREQPSNLGKKGFFSYFISALGPDGKPAGFVTGAVASTNIICEVLKMEKPPRELVFNFIGYVAVDPLFQKSGADLVLLKEADMAASQNGLSTDYFVTQVDKPQQMIDELRGVISKISRMEAAGQVPPQELNEQRDSLQRRVRSARLLLRLWGNRYDLKTVPGLLNLEVITDYGNVSGPMPKPEGLPLLELLIRPASQEQNSMPLKDLEILLKGLYAYYEALPGRKIEGTSLGALDEYVRYSMKDVRIDGANVVLAKPAIPD